MFTLQCVCFTWLASLPNVCSLIRLLVDAHLSRCALTLCSNFYWRFLFFCSLSLFGCCNHISSKQVSTFHNFIIRTSAFANNY